MEQSLAILIADLSGYTALTEAHGPATAADLIDKYIEIVNSCLVGESVLHQQVGDEVVVISSSADHLLFTTEILVNKLSGENYFLQPHGALHYGLLLTRKNNYFGTALNLTSRMASKASSGNFLCSTEFLEALSEKTQPKVESIGAHSFKNVSEEKELFQLNFETQSGISIDPVCRMLIRKTEAAIKHPATPNLFFCSKECLEIHMNRQDSNLKI